MSRALSLISAFLFAIASTSFGLTPHTILVDGDIGDFSSDELIYADLHYDSPWGDKNELYDLYCTWDANNLYLGVSGAQEGNGVWVYLDIVDDWGFGDITDASGLEYWHRKNHLFPESFKPDYQWELYEMQDNPSFRFFRITTTVQTDNLSGQANGASKGGGSGISGSAELGIPWSVLFPGVPGGVPQHAMLKIIVALSAGDDGTLIGSVHEAIPNQEDDFGANWYDQFKFSAWCVVPVDRDGDCGADSGVSPGDDFTPPPIPKNISATAGDCCVNLQWQKVTSACDLAGYYVWQSTVQGLKGDRLNSTPLASNQFQATGLSNETTYYFCVTSVDTSCNESDTSSQVSATPYSPPMIGHTPVTAFAYPGRPIEIVAQFEPSGQIQSATLYYKRKEDTTYTSVSFSSGKADIPASVTDEGTIYYYIHAVKNDGRSGDFPGNGSVVTLKIDDTQELTCNLVNGGEVSLPDSGESSGRTSLLLASNCGKGTVSIFGAYQSQGILVADSQVPLENIGITCRIPVAVYDFWCEDTAGNKIGFTFSKPVQIRLKYFDSDVSALEVTEQALSMWYWDGARWVRLNSELDISRNTLIATTQHLGRYAIFESEAPAGDETELASVSRPMFVPDRGECVSFNFRGQLENIEIVIYDRAGRKVKTLKGTDWAGVDERDNIVECGPYIYQIKTGSKVISGTVVVVR